MPGFDTTQGAVDSSNPNPHFNSKYPWCVNSLNLIYVGNSVEMDNSSNKEVESDDSASVMIFCQVVLEISGSKPLSLQYWGKLNFALLLASS